jgi:hypothetical protein
LIASEAIVQVPGVASSIEANQTACMLRLQGPSALRDPVAGFLKRLP